MRNAWIFLLLLVLAAVPSFAQTAATPPTAAAPASWEQLKVGFGLSTYNGGVTGTNPVSNSIAFSTQISSTVKNGRLESDALGAADFVHAGGAHLINQETLDWALRLSWNREQSGWYSLLHNWYEHNQSTGISFRSAIGPGIGRHVINNDKIRLTLEGGVAPTTEREQHKHNSTFVAVFFDPSLRWKIGSKASLQGKLNFRFDGHGSDDIRVHSLSSLGYQFSKRVGASFVVTVDFDNKPVQDYRKTNTSTSTNLSISLGRQ